MNSGIKRLLIWAVIAVGIKLVVNHLAWAGVEIFRAEVPVVVNTLVFTSRGFVLDSFRDMEGGPFSVGRWNLNLTKSALVLVIVLHPVVYLSTDVADYFEWTTQIASAGGITREAAAGQRDEFLARKVGHSGFAGYLFMCAETPAKPASRYDVSDEDSYIVLTALLRLVQRGANFLGLRLDGLVELVYWYLVAVLVTVITVLALGKIK